MKATTKAIIHKIVKPFRFRHFSFFTIHFSLFLLFTVPVKSQNLDSLYSVWQDPTKPDSVRVKAYEDYIWKGFLFSKPDSTILLVKSMHTYAVKHNYPRATIIGYNLQGIANHVQGNYTSALELFQKSLVISEEVGYKKGIGQSLGNIGTAFTSQGNYPRALEYYQKSLTIREEIGDQNGLASCLGNIGNIYIAQGNYLRALDYYEKSLAIDEQLGDEKGIAICLGSIGNIYIHQKNYKRALEYQQKALEIRLKIGDKSFIATTLGNIGIIYTDYGNYTRALEFHNKSMAILEELGDKSGIAHTLNSIGTIYFRQDSFALALKYYQKSLAIQEEIGDKRGFPFTLTRIGILYEKERNFPYAIEYCKKGLALAEEMGSLKYQQSACQCLYDIYKSMGNGNEALVYMEKMRVVEDSLKINETAEKLQQMEFAKVMLQDSIAKAEEDRLIKEAHQAEVRKRNKARNSAYVGGFIALILAGGFYSRWRYVHKSKAILQTEKDRSENLLLNILPAEIAAELKEKGRADARDFDMVSILFTDFKGFTEHSAKLSAAELVYEINHCFEGFDAIMEKYSIEKIKTIGDAYMAAGGLPIPSNDSVKNTVFAALEMQEFISNRKTENEHASKPAFEMRVGIHSGPVVAGIVGVKKFQYDIWGDTVNTASRMESSGEVGKVNISQYTYELLKDDQYFEFEHRGKISAKGKGEVEMYFVSMKKESFKMKSE